MTTTATRRDVLGLPPLSGRRLFVGSTVVDSLAAGLVFAFLIIYFQRVTDLSLVDIGAALTVGRLLAMPTPPLVGVVIDRIGPRRVVMIGNVVSFAGLVVCAFAAHAPEIVVGQFLSQLGITAYWTASRGLVEIAAAGEARRRWYALLGALRNVGTGFGSAITALFVSFGSPTTLRVVVATSGAAFLLAAILLSRWKPPTTSDGDGAAVGEDSARTPSRGGFRTVVTDADYVLLLGINLTFVLAAMVLPLVVTIYVTDTIGAPAWYAGALVVINTAMVALLNNPIAGFAERFAPGRVIAVASGVNVVGYAVFAAAGALPGGGYVAGAVLALVAIVVYSLAEVVATPPISDLSVSLARPEIAGRYQGVFQLSWNLGMAVAPVLFTALLSAGSTILWLVLGVVSLAAVGGADLLARRTTTRSAVGSA
ncbi:hypothetical protein ASG12_20135 [Williamsia sp. Leaf354]|jgi:MFS family permease|uniref:MFS transporter n=1 Tax=Williamsia sp. Leaf354 TaxID=1736349 RepID=UPI0007149CCD|nr:MFS transporter [Williamsia sp. Leaf354]KQR96452.1 hypothetical protein ASG12_20135 [Williamsia sp. Leaf354]